MNTIRIREWVSKKIAWLLPKEIVKWCSLRLMAHATQGKWGMEYPDDVSIMTALDRWND